MAPGCCGDSAKPTTQSPGDLQIGSLFATSDTLNGVLITHGVNHTSFYSGYFTQIVCFWKLRTEGHCSLERLREKTQSVKSHSSGGESNFQENRHQQQQKQGKVKQPSRAPPGLRELGGLKPRGGTSPSSARAAKGGALGTKLPLTLTPPSAEP